MDDLAAMLHPWTCVSDGGAHDHPDYDVSSRRCHRAAAAIAPRLTPDREAHPGEPHKYQARCVTCGEVGYVRVSIVPEVAASQPVPTEPEEADRG